MVASLEDTVLASSRDKLAEAVAFEAHVGVELSGDLHLGTMSTIYGAFAVAKLVAESTRLPSKVVLGVLENHPIPTRNVPGDVVYYVESPRVTSEFITELLSSINTLLEGAKAVSDIDYFVQSYATFQKQRIVREEAVRMLAAGEPFSRVLSPFQPRMEVYVPCDKCGLADIHGKHLEIQDVCVNDFQATIKTYCPDHLYQSHLFTAENDQYLGLSTMPRNVAKELAFAKKWEEDRVLCMPVKGSDWIVDATIISESLEYLGFDLYDRPRRVFAPIILGSDGHKLSKSEAGTSTMTYAQYKEFDDLYGRKGSEILFEFAREWTQNPVRRLESMSLDYMRELLSGNALFDL